MLKERATDLQTQIETLKQAKKGVTTTNTLATRRNELRTSADSLTKAMDKVRLLRKAGIVVPLNAALCHAQKTVWTLLRDTQKEDPSYISSDSGIQKKRDAQLTFDPLVKQLGQTCKEAWEKYAREQTPQVEAFLLGVFSKDAAHRDAVADIKTRLARINTTANGFPDSLAVVNVFRSDCEAVRDAWQSIIGNGLPPDVEKFFTQMRSSTVRRVSLALLTPEVQQWINERNIADGFSIVAD